MNFLSVRIVCYEGRRVSLLSLPLGYLAPALRRGPPTRAFSYAALLISSVLVVFGPHAAARDFQFVNGFASEKPGP